MATETGSVSGCRSPGHTLFSLIERKRDGAVGSEAERCRQRNEGMKELKRGKWRGLRDGKIIIIEMEG